MLSEQAHRTGRTGFRRGERRGVPQVRSMSAPPSCHFGRDRGVEARAGSLAEIPFPWTDLSCWLCVRQARRGVSVRDGDADLQFRDLAIEAPCHQGLAERLHAVHLAFGGSRYANRLRNSHGESLSLVLCGGAWISASRIHCSRRLPDRGRSAPAIRIPAPPSPLRVSVMAIPTADRRSALLSPGRPPSAGQKMPRPGIAPPTPARGPCPRDRSG